MNPNQGPVGPQKEFTEESLNAKFSFSFTRRQLIALARALQTVQMPVMDANALHVCEIIDEIDRIAFKSITSKDYKTPDPTPPPTPTQPAPEVKVN